MNKRLVELDILRGLSILGMILVITPGDWSQRFEWMNHAAWQGYPLSDMIFPSFLLCVGMSMAISFTKGRNQDKTAFGLFLKIVKRTILLLGIGLLVNGFPSYDLETIRIPGVLQRIALCYFIVGVIWILLKSQTVKNQIRWLTICGTFTLLSYYVLLYYIPLPEVGIGGVTSDNSWPVSIDQYVFGVHHLWEWGLTGDVVTYDPEGILASFPASVNVILGLIIGILYVHHKNRYSIQLLFGVGISLLLLGVALDYFEIMPIIKKIWTSSFVLYSGGFSLLILALIRILLRYIPKTEKVCYPFIVYGSNAILAFVLGNICIPIFELSVNDQSIRKIGYDFFQTIIPNGQWSSFMFSLMFLLLLFFLLQFFYKRRIFIKV